LQILASDRQVLKAVRGTFQATATVPQDLSVLLGHPDYVDSVTEANYDIDYMPDNPGELSRYIQVRYEDGWRQSINVDQLINSDGTTVGGFRWWGGKIWPEELNQQTAPQLCNLKAQVDKIRDDYNTLFIMQAFTSAVFPLLLMAAPRVGPIAAPRGGLQPIRLPGRSGQTTASIQIAGGRQIRGNFPRTAAPGEVLYRKDSTGSVTHYQVYGPDGLPLRRVDLVGKSHGGIPTPHVQEYTRNVNPKTGQTFANRGTVRPATPDEIP
jgi:hypothetical protein